MDTLGLALMFSILLSLGGLIGYQFTPAEKKEISVLAEKKRCDEAKGEFNLEGEIIFNPISERWNWDELSKFNMSCTKSYTEGNKQITEEIFNYEFNDNNEHNPQLRFTR